MTTFADRVKDTSTTTGTGDFTVSGTASSGFVALGTAYSTGTVFFYCIEHTSSNEWEVGKGYLSASTTLVRDTVLANSSGTNTQLNFSAGTKNVFVDVPAAFCNQVTRGRVYALARGMAMR